MAPKILTHQCSFVDKESSYRAGPTSGVVDLEIVHDEGDGVVLRLRAGVDGTRHGTRQNAAKRARPAHTPSGRTWASSVTPGRTTKDATAAQMTGCYGDGKPGCTDLPMRRELSK